MPRSLLMITAAAWLMGAGFTSAARAATIHVDASAPPGGNGTSWQRAYATLQPALKRAKSGDVIRIAQGVYTPAGRNGDRTTTFIVKDGVTLQGGYAGRSAANPSQLNPAVFITRLSGDLNSNDRVSADGQQQRRSDNSYHVLYMKNVGRQTQLRGLVISGGHADGQDSTSHRSMGGGLLCLGSAKPTIMRCVFEDNFAAWFGAGMRAHSSPVLKSCTFRANQTGFANGMGAGAWLRKGSVHNCRFIGNTGGIASTGGGGVFGQRVRITSSTFDANGSGAIVCGHGSMIRNCLIINNSAEDGGGLFVTDGDTAVIDSDFISNSSASFGGAIFTREQATVTIINCRMSGNQSSAGAAIFNRGSLHASNCVLTGNNLPFGGAHGTIVNTGDMHLVNCTIAFNSNTFASAAIVNDGSASIDNSIIWDNDADGHVNESTQIHSTSGSISLMHNSISGWSGDMGGVACMNESPNFIAPAGNDGVIGTRDDDVRIAANSSCRNAGSQALLPEDAFDLDRDGNRNESLPVDVDHEPRIVGPEVDLGAHEAQ